jgi:hypothetical protein
MELPPDKAIERRELPIFRLDHGNHSFLCGCTVESRGSVPITLRPTGYVTRGVLPRASQRLRRQGWYPPLTQTRGYTDEGTTQVGAVVRRVHTGG